MNKVEQRFVPLFSRSDVQLMIGLEPHTDQQMLETMSNPFNKVGESPTSNIYLGRLVSRVGLYNTKVYIEVKKDQCHPAFASNQQHDQLAKEQLIAHTILGAQSGSPLARMFTHLPSPDSNGNQNLFGPLMFCKQQLLFFNPPCPDCGEPLKDCRDDEFLAQNGLPTYNASTQRFLYCGSCVEQDNKVKFYAVHGDADKNIAGPKELISSFTNLFNLIDKDLDDIPCMSCEQRSQCYPDGVDVPTRALDLLVPFSFHNFYIRVVEYFPHNLQEVLSSINQGSATRQPKMSLGRLYTDAKDPRYMLETVLAKLNLFFMLAAQTKEFILKTGRPHSDLCPENVVLRFNNKDSLTPFYWNFDLRLRGIDNVESKQTSSNVEWKAIRGTRPEFQHPSIRARGSITEAVDFYSLGVIFFNAIFGLDKKDFDLVMQRCLSFIQKLKSKNIVDFDEAKRYLVGEIDKTLMQHIPKSSVLNQGLWKELLLVGFRLVNDHGDFAYYQGSLDKAFINLLKDVAVLRSKMYRMLFHESPVLKQDLQQVIWELLGAQGTTGGATAKSEPPKPAASQSSVNVAEVYGIPPQSVPQSTPDSVPDGDPEQTMILGKTDIPARPQAKIDIPAPPVADNPDFESTMIIGNTQDHLPSDPPMPAESGPGGVFSENVDATVVLNKDDFNIKAERGQLKPEDFKLNNEDDDWSSDTLVIRTQDTYASSEQNRDFDVFTDKTMFNQGQDSNDFGSSSSEDSLEDATIVFKPNRDKPVFPQEEADAPVGDDATIIMKRNDIGEIKDDDDQFGSDTVVVRSSFLKDKGKDK